MSILSLRFLFTTAIVASLSMSVQSRAALIYEIKFDQLEYMVVPGQILNVKILLVETSTAGEPSVLVGDGTNGLVSLATRVNFGQGLRIGDADTVQFPDVDSELPTGTSINSIFDFRLGLIDNPNRTFTLSGASTTGPVRLPVVPGAMSYSLELGMVQFMISPTFAGSASLDFDPSTFDVTFNPFVSVTAFYLDSTITAVPEPGTISLLAVASLGGVTLRWRSRRQSPIGQV